MSMGTHCRNFIRNFAGLATLWERGDTLQDLQQEIGRTCLHMRPRGHTAGHSKGTWQDLPPHETVGINCRTCIRNFAGSATIWHREDTLQDLHQDLRRTYHHMRPWGHTAGHSTGTSQDLPPHETLGTHCRTFNRNFAGLATTWEHGDRLPDFHQEFRRTCHHNRPWGHTARHSIGTSQDLRLHETVGTHCRTFIRNFPGLVTSVLTAATRRNIPEDGIHQEMPVLPPFWCVWVCLWTASVV
jgi:hypothetical protein